MIKIANEIDDGADFSECPKTTPITRVDEVVEIDTASIPIGSSVSAGTKLCKDGVIKAEMIRL